jgi:hypothetical protein
MCTSRAHGHHFVTVVVVVDYDGVRLCFWTVTINGPIAHPTNDVWVWKSTVELCWWGKTKELAQKPDHRVHSFPSVLNACKIRCLQNTGSIPGQSMLRCVKTTLTLGQVLTPGILFFPLLIIIPWMLCIHLPVIIKSLFTDTAPMDSAP